MGRLSRWLVGGAFAAGWSFVAANPVAAFEGFGEGSADSTYGSEIRFEVALEGGAPDRLELLLRTPGSDAAFVASVDPGRTDATYVWDTSLDYLTPNTLVTYQWRATEGEEEIVSEEASIRYEDDRPGLDWQSAQLGETTVHWYGDAEAVARRFGELAAVGVEQGEALLGTQLAGPVDVFVYDARDDFFGALGPGAREWTGAAAFSEIRTIFMWLEGGPQEYLETAIVHEVSHIVFFDATDNPYHEPATWVNEGIAVWAEAGDGASQTEFVRENADEGLFAFDALSARLPIGDIASSLSYAQGASMIDYIIDTHGAEVIARMTAAYREGASDDEAVAAATGMPADEVYAAFYAQFGVDMPTPVEPEPIRPSNVERPEAGEVDPGGVDGPPTPPGDPAPTPEPAQLEAWMLVLLLGAAAAAAVGVAVLVARRAARSGPG